MKPFRVLRYRLDIEAAWVLVTTAGYCVLSRRGQLRLINDEGQIVVRLDGLPHANSVIQLGAVGCLLATTEASHSRVYFLSLDKLGLDLIF